MVTTLGLGAVQIFCAPQPASQCLRTEWCSERSRSSGICMAAKTSMANPARPTHHTAISEYSRRSEKADLLQIVTMLHFLYGSACFHKATGSETSAPNKPGVKKRFVICLCMTEFAQLLPEPVVLPLVQRGPRGPRTLGGGLEEVDGSTHCSWRYN